MKLTTLQDAIHIQDGVNAAGIAHSMSRAFSEIWEEAFKRNEAHTSQINSHPVTQLYLLKLIDLMIPSLSITQEYADIYSIVYGEVKEWIEQAEGLQLQDVRIRFIPANLTSNNLKA